MVGWPDTISACQDKCQGSCAIQTVFSAVLRFSGSEPGLGMSVPRGCELHVPSYSWLTWGLAGVTGTCCPWAAASPSPLPCTSADSRGAGGSGLHPPDTLLKALAICLLIAEEHLPVSPHPLKKHAHRNARNGHSCAVLLPLLHTAIFFRWFRSSPVSLWFVSPFVPICSSSACLNAPQALSG